MDYEARLAEAHREHLVAAARAAASQAAAAAEGRLPPTPTLRPLAPPGSAGLRAPSAESLPPPSQPEAEADAGERPPLPIASPGASWKLARLKFPVKPREAREKMTRVFGLGLAVNSPVKIDDWLLKIQRSLPDGRVEKCVEGLPLPPEASTTTARLKWIFDNLVNGTITAASEAAAAGSK
jgi:hypothetical protein